MKLSIRFAVPLFMFAPSVFTCAEGARGMRVYLKSVLKNAGTDRCSEQFIFGFRKSTKVHFVAGA